MTLLRRHGVWLIIATVVGIAGAWLFHALGARVYLSTAQVDVEPNPAVAGAAVAPNMATEQQVATSGVIVDSTAAALGVAPRSLAGSLVGQGDKHGQRAVDRLHQPGARPGPEMRCRRGGCLHRLPQPADRDQGTAGA